MPAPKASELYRVFYARPERMGAGVYHETREAAEDEADILRAADPDASVVVDTADKSFLDVFPELPITRVARRRPLKPPEPDWKAPEPMW